LATLGKKTQGNIVLRPEWLLSALQWGQFQAAILSEWLHLDWRHWFQLGVLLISGFWFYRQIIQRSRSARLFKGIFLILVALGALLIGAMVLRLNLLVTLLGFGLQMLILASVVVFQPELRRFLSTLGQSPLFSQSGWLELATPTTNAAALIEDLVQSVRFLQKSRTGALIVFESADGAGEHYLETGTQMDAQLSTELLLTLFHPKTPLHDGAVVIDRRHRIRAAGVLLPLTEDPKLSWQYGTRHRAAIGLTELSNSKCLVVSEETGGVSWVHGGKITKLPDLDTVEETIKEHFHSQLPPALKPLSTFKALVQERMQPAVKNPADNKLSKRP